MEQDEDGKYLSYIDSSSRNSADPLEEIKTMPDHALKRLKRISNSDLDYIASLVQTNRSQRPEAGKLIQTLKAPANEASSSDKTMFSGGSAPTCLGLNEVEESLMNTFQPTKLLKHRVNTVMRKVSEQSYSSTDTNKAAGLPLSVTNMAMD